MPNSRVHCYGYIIDTGEFLIRNLEKNKLRHCRVEADCRG